MLDDLPMHKVKSVDDLMNYILDLGHLIHVTVGDGVSKTTDTQLHDIVMKDEMWC